MIKYDKEDSINLIWKTYILIVVKLHILQTHQFFCCFFFFIVQFKIKMILVRSLFWKQNGDTFLLSTLFSKRKNNKYRQYIQVPNNKVEVEAIQYIMNILQGKEERVTSWI
jgi:hypothetical protein